MHRAESGKAAKSCHRAEWTNGAVLSQMNPSKQIEGHNILHRFSSYELGGLIAGHMAKSSCHDHASFHQKSSQGFSNV
jgi:hypothetical protein